MNWHYAAATSKPNLKMTPLPRFGPIHDPITGRVSFDRSDQIVGSHGAKVRPKCTLGKHNSDISVRLLFGVTCAAVAFMASKTRARWLEPAGSCGEIEPIDAATGGADNAKPNQPGEHGIDFRAERAAFEA